MSSAFVPFLQRAETTPARHVDSAAASGSFAAIVPGAANSATTPPAPAACARAGNGTATKPSVSLQKDGDRVTHIRIQCACGEVIELECAY